jgi:hypothetical protein
MPTNYGSQNVRVSTGLLNTVNDQFPGGGNSQFTIPSYMGLAPAQLGQRVTLGLQEIKYDSHVGTLYEGTYQYVWTYSADQCAPAVGMLAFWKSRAAYMVTTDDSQPTELAGIFINPITRGYFGFIQCIQGGRGTVRHGPLDESGGAVALGHIVFPIANGSAYATSDSVAAVATDDLAIRFGKALGTVSLSGLLVVALDCQQS